MVDRGNCYGRIQICDAFDRYLAKHAKEKGTVEPIEANRGWAVNGDRD